jgi:hypothetical protein
MLSALVYTHVLRSSAAGLPSPLDVLPLAEARVVRAEPLAHRAEEPPARYAVVRPPMPPAHAPLAIH